MWDGVGPIASRQEQMDDGTTSNGKPKEAIAGKGTS